MPHRRPHSTWTSPSAEPERVQGSLAERLTALTTDRATPARRIVRESARVLLDWVHDRPLAWAVAQAEEQLEEGLEDWYAAHGWRAVVTRFRETLYGLVDLAEQQQLGCRSTLSEGLGLWLGDGEAAPGTDWSGGPLAPGARLIDPARVAAHALGREDRARGLSHGETIVVLGDSEALLGALIGAHEAGLAPRPRLGEGGPHREGLRLARRLVDAGLQPTICYDVSLAAEVHAADRVWISSEAVGGQEFIAPAGCALLLARAREAEVQCELLAPSDARTPSGRAELPTWNDDGDWLLWEDAPSSVRLEAGVFERVSLGLCRHVICEDGRLAPHAFSHSSDVLQAVPPREPGAPLTDQADPEPALRVTERSKITQR